MRRALEGRREAAPGAADVATSLVRALKGRIRLGWQGLGCEIAHAGSPVFDLVIRSDAAYQSIAGYMPN
jgi:hypothetical protein